MPPLDPSGMGQVGVTFDRGGGGDGSGEHDQPLLRRHSVDRRARAGPRARPCQPLATVHGEPQDRLAPRVAQLRPPAARFGRGPCQGQPFGTVHGEPAGSRAARLGRGARLAGQSGSAARLDRQRWSNARPLSPRLPQSSMLARSHFPDEVERVRWTPSPIPNKGRFPMTQPLLVRLRFPCPCSCCSRPSPRRLRPLRHARHRSYRRPQRRRPCRRHGRPPRFLPSSCRSASRRTGGRSTGGCGTSRGRRDTRVFLTRDEAVLQLSEDPRGVRPVLRLSFQGGRPAETVDGLDRLPGSSHYLRGSDPAKWVRDVPRFGRVQLGQLYPGVDVVFYDSQRELEYDVVLAAGVDPSLVRARLDGADALEVDARGDLVVHTPSGTVTQRRPFAYQEIAGNARTLVEACYEVTGKEQPPFPPRAARSPASTVIDPVVVYSSYLGGNNEDLGVAASTSAGKKVYVTGYTKSTDFPVVGFGARGPRGKCPSRSSTSPSPGAPTETSLYVGGAGNDEGLAIAAQGGRAFVVGQTSGSFPAMAPQPVFGGGSWAAFLFGFDFNLTTTIASTHPRRHARGCLPRGRRAGSTRLGDSGATSSAKLPDAQLDARLSRLDRCLRPTEYDVTGGIGAVAILLSTYLGTASTDIGSSIDVDANGFAYVRRLQRGNQAHRSSRARARGPQASASARARGSLVTAATRGSNVDLATTAADSLTSRVGGGRERGLKR